MPYFLLQILMIFQQRNRCIRFSLIDRNACLPSHPLCRPLEKRILNPQLKSIQEHWHNNHNNHQLQIAAMFFRKTFQWPQSPTSCQCQWIAPQKDCNSNDGSRNHHQYQPQNHLFHPNPEQRGFTIFPKNQFLIRIPVQYSVTKFIIRLYQCKNKSNWSDLPQISNSKPP